MKTKMLYFRGEDRGFMSGVMKYIVLSDDPDVIPEDHCYPGFNLYSITEVGDLPYHLPFEEPLIRR